MRVRPATEADADAILDVHERAVYELAGEYYRQEVLDAWTDLDGGEDSAGDGTTGKTKPRTKRTIRTMRTAMWTTETTSSR